MKKKVFNQQSIVGTRPTGLFIRMNPRSGAITFSKDLAAKLELTKKDAGIQIIQDEERPSDWYIELSTSPEAFKTRSKFKNISALIQSCYLVRQVLTSCDLDTTRSYKFLVAPDPVDGMYAIITKSAQTKLKQAA